jgi:hypothetical protein
VGSGQWEFSIALKSKYFGCFLAILQPRAYPGPTQDEPKVTQDEPRVNPGICLLAVSFLIEIATGGGSTAPRGRARNSEKRKTARPRSFSGKRHVFIGKGI